MAMPRLWAILNLLILNSLIPLFIPPTSALLPILWRSDIVRKNHQRIATKAEEAEFGEGAARGIIDATAGESTAGPTAAPVPAAVSEENINGSHSNECRMKSNKIRWAIHGIVTELFHNIFLRTLNRFRTLLFCSRQQRLEVEDCQRYRQQPRHEVAVVTGATGGIGSQIAHDLAFKGYDVVVAARNATRGLALVEDIRGMLKIAPVKDNSGSTSGEVDLPKISFVEYHADAMRSALTVASLVKDLRSPMSVLINNAGIMGKSKQLTMKVNLLGPAMLTFALLPLMMKSANEGICSKPPIVINVGSSAHLRATSVIDQEYLSSCGCNGHEKPWIDTLPDVADNDLSTYAQSKLALMQFSTLLRHWLPKDNSSIPIQIYDAHPGLVWTPLLCNHIGNRAVEILTKTGLASLIYKSPSEGAQAIVSALDTAPSVSKRQVYFVNGRRGGYAAVESRSIGASIRLWHYLLGPELEGTVKLPKGWGLDVKKG